jgi:hypothetical protein
MSDLASIPEQSELKGCETEQWLGPRQNRWSRTKGNKMSKKSLGAAEKWLEDPIPRPESPSLVTDEEVILGRWGMLGHQILVSGEIETRAKTVHWPNQIPRILYTWTPFTGVKDGQGKNKIYKI